MVSRFWRRPATSAEIERALREDPSDDLRPPTGLLILATVDGTPVGGGVRLLSSAVAEITRVWVTREARRRGYGTQIVSRLERHAAKHRRTRIRLDTRSDLTEALTLYARLGYREVASFNDAPYAQHWLEKDLTTH